MSQIIWDIAGHQSGKSGIIWEFYGASRPISDLIWENSFACRLAEVSEVLGCHPRHLSLLGLRHMESCVELARCNWGVFNPQTRHDANIVSSPPV